jgi:FtsP/CotA-like multicopper oxidase with cupredoxin domain
MQWQASAFTARVAAASITVLVWLAYGTPAVRAGGAGRDEPPRIADNDNRQPAGELRGGTLFLALRAARGIWQPEGAAGPALAVDAFGEIGAPLTVPAPLVRVRQGVEIAASVRNDLDTPIRVHGLCARDGSPCAPMEVPAGGRAEARFTAGHPGTYYYWATTTGMPLAFRASRDTQLSGAFVVDPASGPVAPDRLLVITEWTSLTPAELAEVAAAADPGRAFLKRKPTVIFTINGRAWPHTERLTYDVGERVAWRVVNLSTQAHPMHLHGFYFDVERQGDGVRDEAIAPGQRPRAVTHLMAPGSTLRLTWTPDRPGGWLFHCHTMVHVSPTLHVDGSPRLPAFPPAPDRSDLLPNRSAGAGAGPSSPHAHDNSGGRAARGDVDEHHNRGSGMAGLVLGVVVRGPHEAPGTGAGRAARQLVMAMRSEPRRFGEEPAFGFHLSEGPHLPPAGPVPVAGPPLVLKRDEPVEITLVNELPEATSIHWHGMELESYYDGVHGWSGSGGQLTPMIEPGGRFTVRFTPPRAGTFIYHTHLHDNRQLTSGLYGALLVVEPGEVFDEAGDHVFVVGRLGPAVDAPAAINGERALQTVWRAGSRHRVRLVNITPNDTVTVSLRTAAAPVEWRAVAKDGAALPPDRPRPLPPRR